MTPTFPRTRAKRAWTSCGGCFGPDGPPGVWGPAPPRLGWPPGTGSRRRIREEVKRERADREGREAARRDAGNVAAGAPRRYGEGVDAVELGVESGMDDIVADADLENVGDRRPSRH